MGDDRNVQEGAWLAGHLLAKTSQELKCPGQQVAEAIADEMGICV